MERKEFDLKLNQLLDHAEQLIPNELLEDLPFMEDVPDVHDWHRFELDLWDIGEEIRLLILESKKKPSKLQVERILKICLNRNAKRGRESFIMLLGKKCYACYAPEIVPLLNDEYVDGHTVDTLYKMDVSEYVKQIEPFVNHKRTWIKNTAKKYIQKYR